MTMLCVAGESRRTRLRDRTAESLLDMVVSRGLVSGDRLPPERELVDSMGVSRTVVREALNLLEARGIVSIEHGRGAVVSGGDTGAVRDTLGLILRFRSDALSELLEVRKILEVEIAGLAAERAVPGDIQEMKLQLERMRDAIDVPEGYVDADVEFHALLSRSVGNEVLLSMFDPVVDLLRASRQVTATRRENAERALREHHGILRCVERGDAEGARMRMREHLTETQKDINAVMHAEAETSHPGRVED